ncbi:MAG: DUF6484 domain-containing protein [Polyangiaceae bacterium]
MKRRREPLSPRLAGPAKTEPKRAPFSHAARASTARAEQRPEPASLSGAIVGRLVVGSTPAAPRVDFDGNRTPGPVRARTTLPLDTASIDRAIATGQAAVLYFENGDPARPILVGLIQDDKPQSPLQELLLAPRSAVPASEERAAPKKVEARLDGERVILEGHQEITLKCGEASITLRRDGKIIVRGAYVETHARGVNRIKGGAVKIN